jgi:glycosyltransferase involved in cell wall biosynthesis
MRIAFITAGAAGMFCGSCMRDNTLATALVELGHDALLIPTFTPIRTDDEDVSEDRVFFGGINVYLREKFRLFRHTPAFLDGMLNAPWLLRWVSRFASSTKYHKLTGLTISMLKGEHGPQRKGVESLLAWLRDEVQPEVVLLTNVLLSGIIPELKDRLGVPVIATLQGDDIFLDALPEDGRRACIELVRQNCEGAEAFICTSRYYADFMADYLGIDASRMRVVHPGINLKGHGGDHLVPRQPPYRIGYFARICPEKGFHNIIDAFIRLRETPGAPPCKLRASGWLGDGHKTYFHEQVQRLAAYGLSEDFEYVATPDHASKVRFFHSVDVLSVPTVYREPKGLYILEAWANSVPVVQPQHGAFPELIGATGGGILVEPNDPAALADGIRQLLEQPELRDEMGRNGRAAVEERFSAPAMARNTLSVLEQFVPTAATPVAAP